MRTTLIEMQAGRFRLRGMPNVVGTLVRCNDLGAVVMLDGVTTHEEVTITSVKTGKTRTFKAKTRGSRCNWAPSTEVFSLD